MSTSTGPENSFPTSTSAAIPSLSGPENKAGWGRCSGKKRTPLNFPYICRERQTDRQTDRQTETERQRFVWEAVVGDGDSRGNKHLPLRGGGGVVFFLEKYADARKIMLPLQQWGKKETLPGRKTVGVFLILFYIFNIFLYQCSL